MKTKKEKPWAQNPLGLESYGSDPSVYGHEDVRSGSQERWEPWNTGRTPDIREPKVPVDNPWATGVHFFGSEDG